MAPGEIRGFAEWHKLRLISAELRMDPFGSPATLRVEAKCQPAGEVAVVPFQWEVREWIKVPPNDGEGNRWASIPTFEPTAMTAGDWKRHEPDGDTLEPYVYVPLLWQQDFRWFEFIATSADEFGNPGTTYKIFAKVPVARFGADCGHDGQAPLTVDDFDIYASTRNLDEID